MMGKNMKAALEFATKYPGWHSVANDYLTKKILTSLEKMSKIEIVRWNENNWQFRLNLNNGE